MQSPTDIYHHDKYHYYKNTKPVKHIGGGVNPPPAPPFPQATPATLHDLPSKQMLGSPPQENPTTPKKLETPHTM